jgi:hypothetical protein
MLSSTTINDEITSTRSIHPNPKKAIATPSKSKKKIKSKKKAEAATRAFPNMSPLASKIAPGNDEAASNAPKADLNTEKEVVEVENSLSGLEVGGMARTVLARESIEMESRDQENAVEGAKAMADSDVTNCDELERLLDEMRLLVIAEAEKQKSRLVEEIAEKESDLKNDQDQLATLQLGSETDNPDLQKTLLHLTSGLLKYGRGLLRWRRNRLSTWPSTRIC